jgi:ornithine decarboxylase
MDLDTVRESHTRLRDALPEARMYYAVKANPAPEIIRLLVACGAGFDVAGREEIELCLAEGARPEMISYGNTVKKARDIEFAYLAGVRRFTFDSEADLANIAAVAPGCTVSCRILVDSSGSQTPFGQKFGCAPEMAADLLVRAAELGLDPEGVAFHVGSQHMDPAAWDAGIAAAGAVTRAVAARGVRLRGLNIGGGFPGSYLRQPPPLTRYATAIRASIAEHFGEATPELVIEPGRVLVADAGLIRSEVVLVSRKADRDERRWVYLDIGRYQGMAETENEMIAYRLSTAHDGGEDGPVVIAGPSCDGDDVLYQHTPYRLPLALQAGDHVDILSTGAYTQSYSSVSFNGFPPLRTYFVGGEPEFGEFAGRHVLAEFEGISPALLDDAVFLRETLENVLDKAGATVLDMTYRQFEPQGVTVLALLSESHASIHTYPERGAVFVDVFTCGRRADPELAVQLLRDALGAPVARTNTVYRGQEDR